MLFGPEDGMPLEQSIEIAWSNWVSPSTRARVLGLAGTTGRTRNAIILEWLAMFLKNLSRMNCGNS
jgi:hypothetical protein